jgi:uncharacterized protein YggE
MPRVPIAAAFSFSLCALSLFVAPSILAQSVGQAPLAQAPADSQAQNFQAHVITVGRGGEARAKPDLGILVMSIRSSSPIAEEAVGENGRKAKAVEAALAQLGFSPAGYKITSVTFGQAGNRPPFGPAQGEVVAYEANQFVYVLFEAADLQDVGRLTEKTAAVIEALRKSGAIPANAAGPGFPMMQTPLIIYTIKDSAQYEKQALQQAIARARDAADDMAKGTGVQITGVRNVRSSFLYGNYAPRSNNAALQGLNYRWYSTSSDEVEIGVSATVDYDFK